MKPPGLLSREIIEDDGGDMVTVREVWDPRVKDCPLLVFRPWTWPLEIRKDVENVTRTFQCPREAAVQRE